MAKLLPFPRTPSSKAQNAGAVGNSASAADSASSESRSLNDDVLLARSVRKREPGATTRLFERFGTRIERVLYSVLGPDEEIEDLLHEVFVRAIEGIDKLAADERLGGWLVSIAIFTAREWIRKKSRLRWFPLFAEVPEREAPAIDPHITAAARDTFTVLETLSADERVVFSLRYIEELELEEIALATDMSLSTVKRRLKDAQRRFRNRGKHFPTLAEWLEKSWQTP